MATDFSAWLALGGALDQRATRGIGPGGCIARRPPSVGWVMDTDIDSMSEAIHTLQVDATVTLSKQAPPDAKLLPIVQAINKLSEDWTAWVTDNTGLVMRAIGEGDLAAFKVRYNNLRDSFLAYGGKTGARKVGQGDGAGVPSWILPVVLGGAFLLLGGWIAAPIVAASMAKKAALAAL